MDHPEFLVSWQNNRLNKPNSNPENNRAITREGRRKEASDSSCTTRTCVSYVQILEKRVDGAYYSREWCFFKHSGGFRGVSFRLYSNIKFLVFRAHFPGMIVPLHFPVSEAPPLTPSSIQPSPTSYQPSSSTVPVNRGETVCYCVTCIHVSGIWPLSWKYTYCVNQGM